MPDAKKGKCTPCELSASLGLAFGICDVALKDKVDCKKLEDQLVAKKIKRETVFRQLYDAAIAAGKPVAARDIKEAADFIRIKL